MGGVGLQVHRLIRAGAPLERPPFEGPAFNYPPPQRQALGCAARRESTTKVRRARRSPRTDGLDGTANHAIAGIAESIGLHRLLDEARGILGAARFVMNSLRLTDFVPQ